VVDIGAEANYYCADLTRTYPVSGTFTSRQKEIYNLVLDTQDHIANIAKPGMWLFNKEKPEQSLHHLAYAFLEKKGYAKYFPHGLGHFLGLDVHDVGNRAEPLEEGDVFTIEPGIYIPAEKIGVRIEDDYWMAKDGVVCLSEELPKNADDIERMVQSKNESAQAIADECCDDEHDVAHG
jgi:Xaa-Pro aminopeptidase